jgi:type IV secretory pathway VirB6-like protein
MKKNEFLDILKQSLSGGIRPDKIKQNLDYYDQYIGNNPATEEEIIEKLGDPRLIAKTIIESERIAKERGRFGGEGDSRSHYQEPDDTESSHNGQDRRSSVNGRSFFFGNFRWYHKLILFLLVVLLLIVAVIVGRVIISILFTLGIPIIIIVLLLSLFRRR